MADAISGQRSRRAATASFAGISAVYLAGEPGGYGARCLAGISTDEGGRCNRLCVWMRMTEGLYHFCYRLQFIKVQGGVATTTAHEACGSHEHQQRAERADGRG